MTVEIVDTSLGARMRGASPVARPALERQGIRLTSVKHASGASAGFGSAHPGTAISHAGDVGGDAPLRREAGIGPQFRRSISGRKCPINQGIVEPINGVASTPENKVGHADMWNKVAKFAACCALACAVLSVATAPTAHAQDRLEATNSGDVGLARSDDASELALRARELFETGMAKKDPRKLAAAAEIMSRLPDVVDLRTDETAPPVEMGARDATIGGRRTTGLVPILMTPVQVLDMAQDIAREKKDQPLVDDLEAAKRALPRKDQRPAAQQSCVWANCCGRWGCWRWCQWW